LIDRWPSAVAVVGAAGAVVVVALLDRAVDYFVPAVVTMAGIYLMAYAIGRPWTAWLALAVLSIVVAVLQVLDGQGALQVNPALGMSVVAVLLWLWTVARRRFADGITFYVQTAGLLGFGAVALVCAALAPRWGALLAGVGFLAHAVWDGYHCRARKVVDRSYAEFCAVFDVVVGSALIVAALVQGAAVGT
jgi:hypothetical protein